MADLSENTACCPLGNAFRVHRAKTYWDVRHEKFTAYIERRNHPPPELIIEGHIAAMLRVMERSGGQFPVKGWSPEADATFRAERAKARQKRAMKAPL